MGKKGNIVIGILIFILIIIAIWIITLKISPYRCCACPPDRYRLYPLSFAMIENHIAALGDCNCPPERGCTLAFWVIPIDLIIAIVVLAGILFYKAKKK